MTIATVGPAAVKGLGLEIGYAVQMACTGVGTMVVIYALREVSGAHTNPCMTIGFALRGDFGWSRVPGYVIAQFLGAITAAALVVAILHPDRQALLPEMQLGPWPAFWIEIVATAILVLVGLATASIARFIGPEAAIANGGSTVMLRWIAGHISSGSMNPARTLGPIIVAGGISAWWVYVTAPLLGMAIAVWLAHRFYPTPSDQETQQSTPHG